MLPPHQQLPLAEKQCLRKSPPYKASARLRLPSRWGVWRKAAGWPSHNGRCQKAGGLTLAWRRGQAQRQAKALTAKPRGDTDQPRHAVLTPAHSPTYTYPLSRCLERINDHYPSISALPPRFTPGFRPSFSLLAPQVVNFLHTRSGTAIVVSASVASSKA